MEKRTRTRTNVSSGTLAVIQYASHSDTLSQKSTRVTGEISNLGTGGMHFRTKIPISIGKEMDIKIVFQQPQKNDLILNAKGVVTHQQKTGVGIKFTDIDINQYSSYMMTMLSR